MIRAICWILALFWIGTANAAERLVLYFDINKTLVATGQPGESRDQAVNNLLSAKYSGIWEEGQKQPMTYLFYVKKVVLPREEKPEEEYRDYTSHFVDWLVSSGHPLAGTVQQEYCCVMKKLSMAGGAVFPAFYRMVDLLSQSGIEFSIVLRSYGPDLDAVAREIESRLGKGFFSGRGFFDSGVLVLDTIGQLDLEQSYSYLTNGKNWVIQDDWAWWKAHGEARVYGKPLYVKRGEGILQIFFDDRLRDPRSSTNIVSTIDVETGRECCFAELMRQGQLVRADTLEAILDENYFVDKVVEALLKKQSRDRLDTSLKGVGEHGGWQQAHLNGGVDQSPLQYTG